MTILQVMADDGAQTVLLRTEHEQEIAAALAERNITFERWPLRGKIVPGMPQDEILDLYQDEVGALCERDALVVVDVAQLHPEDTQEWRDKAAKARSMFLDEHSHAEDEVRFFAHGTGCFNLHISDRVYAVVCTAGDLLSVPAGTRHWFDMGPQPEFAAIRFFKEKDGWVGNFTGDLVAQRFPRLDELTGPTP